MLVDVLHLSHGPLSLHSCVVEYVSAAARVTAIIMAPVMAAALFFLVSDGAATAGVVSISSMAIPSGRLCACFVGSRVVVLPLLLLHPCLRFLPG